MFFFVLNRSFHLSVYASIWKAIKTLISVTDTAHTRLVDISCSSVGLRDERVAIVGGKVGGKGVLKGREGGCRRRG